MGLRFQPRSLLTVFLIAFFIFIVVQSSDMPEKAKMYPWVVGLIALALLAFQLVREILPARGDEPRETRETGADVDFTDEEASPEGRRRTLELFGWIYGFTLLLWLIGFYLSIPVMVFAYAASPRRAHPYGGHADGRGSRHLGPVRQPAKPAVPAGRAVRMAGPGLGTLSPSP
jgi:hypothetical protein